MRTLILVRHSESKLQENLPPQEWRLTSRGRRLCSPLASKVAMHSPNLILTSEEIKARETGKILAEFLDVDCMTAQGLHEHLREKGEILDLDTWFNKISEFFQNPNQLVFGLETANQARERFIDSIHAVMEQHQGGNVAVVTHGTVMSLYYQELSGKDPYKFWRQLGLPAFYTVSWPEGDVSSIEMDIVENIQV